MIDALLVFSLIFGGISIDLASRTPTLLYFDVFLPLVLCFRILWFEWPLFSDRSMNWLVSACVLFQIASAIANPTDIYKSLLTIKCLVFGFLLYCMLQKRGIPEWCIPLWLGGAGIVTLAPYYSALRGGVSSISAIKDALVTPMGRSNYVASYLLLLLPLGIVLFYRSSLSYRKILSGVSLLFGAAGFFVTFSRAAFLSLLLAVLMSIPLMRSAGLRLRHSAFLLVFVAFTLIVFSQQVVLAYEFLGDKFVAGDESRVELWKKAVDAFRQNPVLGVGPGQFVNYTHETDAENSKLGAHNTYLQILAEDGILGSIPIFASMFLVLLRSYVAAKSSLEPKQVAIWVGLFAGMIHNAFESTFWSQHFQALFWLLSAVSVTHWHSGKAYRETGRLWFADRGLAIGGPSVNGAC